VFEGELTEGKLKEVQIGLKKRIKADKDSILFYKLRTSRDIEKEAMGIEKAMPDVFI
jgi:CRISPR-associated protein Cas2